ncbi:MAG TPA: hypothetical protein PK736_08165, partial [Bacteroidia bacterium]|nr:hypothetical protein [Bacteroidia bacterium]
SGNIVSNCNISNYFSATLATNGILLTATGNSGWSITNNRLFQTANRTYTTGNAHNGISVQSGSGYIIIGNTIGFANSGGTLTTNMVGAAAPISGFPGNYAAVVGIATTYTGINATFTSGGINSLIQSNIIAGFALFTSTGGGAAFTAINVTTGNVTIGGASAVLGNTIGSTSGLSSIYLATTANGGAFFGIRTSPAAGNTATVQNNTIGAVDAIGTTALLTGSFVGLDGFGAGNIEHINNTIGNATADNIRTGYTTLSGVTATNLSNTGIFVAAGTTGTTATMSAIRSTNSGQSYNASFNTIRGLAMNATVSTALGITSSGAITGAVPSVTINNNAIGTSGLGWMRYVAANSGALTGISMTNTVAILHSIQSNDFRGIIHNVASTNSLTFINLTGATANGNAATISDNTFTNLNVNTSGSVTFISHSYVVSSSGRQTINNNAIVTAFNKGTAGGTITLATSGSSSVAGAIINHTNNNFSNITVTGATIIAGWISSDGGTANKTYSNNTFSNWIGGTSSITAMSCNFGGGAGGNGNVLTNNTITNITGQGAITGIVLGASGTTHSAITNTITGLSSTGVGGNVTGITSAAPTAGNINGNIISNLSSTAASGIVTGIAVTGGTLTTVNDNRISGLSGTVLATTSPISNGISVSGGTTININRNKICDIAENGVSTLNLVNGISLSGGTTVTAANNIIGDLRAPVSNNADAIRGIAVTSTTAATSYNLYNNTVYLNASSTGTPFGTTGVFHAANATATTAKLDLRNNIIVNNSTPAGAGISSALRRSVAAILGNYAITSNNNMYYAGVPSAVNAILNDNGTVYGTAAAAFAFGPVGTAGSFQNFVTASRESASFTEVVSNAPGVYFQSVTCSDPTFLHIVNGLTTQLESSGISPNIVTFATDYDGDIRAGSAGYAGTGTAPDVGADEFSGTTPAPSITAVAITPSGSQCVASNRLVSATVTTVIGAITGVVINYSYNGVPQTAITMTNTSGNIWEGTIPAAAPTNATVTWSILATNSLSITSTFNGISYSDDPLLSSCSFLTSSSSTVCSGSPATLTASVFSPSSNVQTYVNHAGA